MREEQFDHIENRIREAAENTRPDFDETAWVKMEALLDADKKRRPFPWLWFLLPLLLIGGSAVYFIGSQESIKTATSSQQIKSSAPTASAGENETIINRGNDITGEKEDKAKETVPQTNSATTAIVSSTNNKAVTQALGNISLAGVAFTQDKKKNTKKSAVKQLVFDIPGNTTPSKKITYSQKGRTKASIMTADESEADQLKANEDSPAFNDKKSIENVNTITGKINTQADSTVVAMKEPGDKNDKKESTVPVNKKAIAEKTGNKILSKFYLLGQAGADNANIQLLSFNKNSKTVFKFGLGIGYQFNKRISIQTGFYSSNKKYIAGPEDYKIAPNSYLARVKMLSTDGECRVYEIPLAFRYNIVQAKRMNYYAVAGISSYLMKKENYYYHYIDYNRYYGKELYYTGNEHLFSVLTFAAGLERKLSEKFYLQAEPAIAIPLAGVGDGKVKLYSSSLVIGVRYFPFKK